MATFSSLVNFCVVSFAVGFGSAAVKGKKKVNNRRKIQNVSKKANRVVHKKSVKHYPQCSLKVRKVQLMKAAWLAKVEFYKVKPVLIEKPVLRKPLPALERPVVRVVVKKEAIKQHALPSIVGALKETRKPYIGKKRNVVGKKYKQPTNKIRKSKSEAKKASGKKCLPATFLNSPPSGNYNKLIELAKSLGYNITHYNSISSIGWVDFGTKNIVLNTGGDLIEYVLCHELVHIGVNLGLINPDIKSYESILSNKVKALGNDYWKQVKQDYKEEEKKEERAAAYLMWMPEFVLSLFTSSASGEAPKESAEGDISTTNSSQGKAVMPKSKKFADLFLSYENAQTTVFQTAELNKVALEVFGVLDAQADLQLWDLLWLGVEIDDEGQKNLFFNSHKQIIAVSKVIAAFTELGVSIFPKEVFKEDIEIFLLGEFTNEAQLRAVVRYAIENGHADKLYRPTGSGDLIVDLKEKGKVTITELSLEESTKVVGVNYLDNGIAEEEVEFKKSFGLDNSLNTMSILDALGKCSNDSELAAFVTYFGNFKHIEELKYQLTPTYAQMTYGHLEVDFSELTLTTSREFFIRSNAFIVGYGEITGAMLLGLILITITGGNDSFWEQSYLDAYLNTITAAEEEQDVYGQEMNDSQQLRVVRENSVAILGTEAYFMKYPYIQLKNNNDAGGVNLVAHYYLQRQIPFFVDKVVLKRVVLGAGVTALYAAFDFVLGILKTILDVAKPGKLFTRAYQTLCTAAEAGLRELQKYAVDYIDANLVLRHYYQDGKTLDITIKGESAVTITGDANFLINGSGVGLTWKVWSASVKKTLRDSFNAMSLKEGETLQDVKAELIDALTKVTEDTTVRRSGECLLEFRGRQLLSYKGLNQYFVTAAKWGSSFKVRELGTSKTLQITYTVVYFYDDKEPKVRGLGQKTVLKYAPKTGATVWNSNNEEVKTDTLLGSECLKGNASRLVQFAEFCRLCIEKLGGTHEDGKVALIGGHHPLAMEAVEAPELTLVNGEWTWTGNRTIQSLDDINTPFYQWWGWATETYYLTDIMVTYKFLWLLLGRAELQQEWDGKLNIPQDLLDRALNHPANSKVKLLNATTGKHTNSLREAEQTTGYICVEEEFSGIRSNFIFQLELASIRECSNAGQSSTIQQVASVYAANPILGEALADGIYAKEIDKDGNVTKLGYKSIEQEDAVLGLIAMAQNDLSVKAIGSEFKSTSQLTNWTLKDLATWNNSIFNSGVNAMYPANSDPYLAFFDSNVGKKFKPVTLVNRVGLFDAKAGQTKFTFVQAMEGSAQNYTMNVGSGYNVSSVASCMAALARYSFVTGVNNNQPLSTLKAITEEIKLWGWVNGLAWKTLYENAWLASYNDKGAKLAKMLNEYRKGSVRDAFGNITVTKEQVIANLKAVLCEVEGIPTTQVKDAWVSKLLWSYRVARALSPVERKEKGVDAALYDLNLDKEEDIKYIAICGAFRRCDQGRFSNNEELLGNDGEKGYGQSIWSLLKYVWDEANDLLPNWLKRKLYKAMKVQLLLDEGKKVSDNKGGENNYNLPDYLLDNAAVDDQGRLITGCLTSAKTLELMGVPSIRFDYACMDSSHNIEIPVKVGKKWLFQPNSPKEVQGAFEHYILYCPLKQVIDEENGEVISLVMDDEVKGGKKFKLGNDICWVWRRNLTAKEVIQKAALRYPNGAQIIGEEVQGIESSLLIDFDDVLKTGAFTRSGAATGFALTLANFLVTISKPSVSGAQLRVEADFKKYGRNQIAGLQGQLREMQRAGIIKRVGKTAPTKQALKVQSTHTAPYLYTEWGTIPVFLINPLDDIVLEGGYKTGDFVSISRTPMIAKCYGVIVLSWDVAIGHLDVCGLMFATSNRGDGDGDPVDLTKENGCISRKDLINYLGHDTAIYLRISYRGVKIC